MFSPHPSLRLLGNQRQRDKPEIGKNEKTNENIKGKHYSKHITLGKEFLESLIETIKCLLNTLE